MIFVCVFVISLNFFNFLYCDIKKILLKNKIKINLQYKCNLDIVRFLCFNKIVCYYFIFIYLKNEVKIEVGIV